MLYNSQKVMFIGFANVNQIFTGHY